MAGYVYYLNSYQFTKDPAVRSRTISGSFPVTLSGRVNCPGPEDESALLMKKHILSEERTNEVIVVVSPLLTLQGLELKTISGSNIYHL